MKLFRRTTSKGDSAVLKYNEEVLFWKTSLEQLIQWYEGEIPTLYGEPCPTISQKVSFTDNIKDNSILTWHKIHQQKKYLEDLLLDQNAFANMKILDIGSGPIASANVFSNCEVYCLDPLIPKYLEIGYPLHFYENTKFISAYAEDIPMPNRFFDGIISVNALDHVDDFEKVASEMERVLKSNGLLRIHLHYHPKLITEPVVLNDKRVLDSFSWCSGLKKISESKKKRGYEIATSSKDNYYTVWTNF